MNSVSDLTAGVEVAEKMPWSDKVVRRERLGVLRLKRFRWEDRRAPESENRRSARGR